MLFQNYASVDIYNTYMYFKYELFSLYTDWLGFQLLHLISH